MQIACRGTFSPFLCTAGYIARGGQDVARTRFVRIQSVRIRLVRAHIQWLYRAGTVDVCALRYGLRGAGTKPRSYARNSFGPVHWNQKSRISPAFRGVVMVAAAYFPFTGYSPARVNICCNCYRRTRRCIRRSSRSRCRVCRNCRSSCHPSLVSGSRKR